MMTILVQYFSEKYRFTISHILYVAVVKVARSSRGLMGRRRRRGGEFGTFYA